MTLVEIVKMIFKIQTKINLQKTMLNSLTKVTQLKYSNYITMDFWNFE